ncbi:MAG: DUF2484 family protein [Rhodobacteraceae bacterium]|nr:DUF2484 family protein [Paracoccaceae bacterium]
MTLSLIAACIWAVTANFMALLPSRDNHWRQAWALIACGIPLLGWVTFENGPLFGFAVLAAGVSVLRWPVIFAVRRMKMWRGGRV